MLVAAIQFTYLIYQAIFKELELDIGINKIVKLSLSVSLIRNIISNTIVDCLMVTYKKSNSTCIFFSMDTTNKDSIHYVVKEISF